MEKIFDWQGNEVKAGMIVYFVQTEPMAFGRFGMFIPDGSGGHSEVWESEEDYEKRKNEETWELGSEYLVVEGVGRLCVQYSDGEMTVVIPFNQFGGSTPSVIAIKGISDKNKQQ